MAEQQLITLSEGRNNELRDKLGGLFLSMEKNLSLQTKTLDGMYKLQIQRYTEDKDRYNDEARKERLASDVSDAVAPQTPEVKNNNNNDSDNDDEQTANSIGQLLSTVIGGLSIAGIVKTMVGLGWRTLIATAIGNFVQKSIENFFDDPATEENEGEQGWKATFAESLGSAATWGFIGSMFGRRLALAGAVIGALIPFGADMVEGFNNMFGTELDPVFWGNIAAGIGGLLAIYLPGMIFRAVSAGISRMRLPPITPDDMDNTSGGTRGNAKGAGIRANVLQNLPDDQLRSRGIIRTLNDQTGRYSYNYAQGSGRSGTVSNEALTELLDEITDKNNLDEKISSVNNPKLRMLMRGLAIAGYAYSAYQLWQIWSGQGDYANYSTAEKTEASGGVVGGLLGGIGGAALAGAIIGAFGTSIGPWGTVAGLLAGGALGGFAGSWLGGEMASFAYGGAESAPPPEIDAAIKAAIAESAGIDASSPVLTAQGTIAPRSVDPMPEITAQGIASMAQQRDQGEWMNTYGDLYNADGTMRDEYTSDYNRLTRYFVNRNSTAAPVSSVAPTAPGVTTDDYIGATAAEIAAANAFNATLANFRVPGPAPVTVISSSPAHTSVASPTYNNSTTNIFQTVDHSSSLSNTTLPFQ